MDIEMKDLDTRHKEEDNYDDNDLDWDDDLYDEGDLQDFDWEYEGVVWNEKPREIFFNQKGYREYKIAIKVFGFLGLEDECNNKHFVNWMMYKQGLVVGHVYSTRGESLLIDHTHSTHEKGYRYTILYRSPVEDGIREISFKNGNMYGDDRETVVTEIREYYDQYRKEELNKILKKAGIATAIGVSLISLITGLSLGLKRKGNDMVHNSTSSSKLTPSKKSTPWLPLEEATGKGLIIIGNNIYLIIGGLLIYLYTVKK